MCNVFKLLKNAESLLSQVSCTISDKEFYIGMPIVTHRLLMEGLERGLNFQSSQQNIDLYVCLSDHSSELQTDRFSTKYKGTAI